MKLRSSKENNKKEKYEIKNKELFKEIEKSKREIMKNSVPLHYIKVDEKIITTVYQIPINRRFSRQQKSTKNKDNYILKTINNDKLSQTRKNNYFHFKPFCSNEMGYKYYNQNLNTCNPHKPFSDNLFNFRKSKSPQIQSSYVSTSMNSSYNFNNHNNKKEIISIRDNIRTPSNSLKINRGFISPFYRRFLNNSVRLKNKNNLNRNERIRHRIINLNSSNNFISNNFNDYKHRTINFNNSLNNYRKILLDKDNNYNNLYSIKNQHIVRSPKIRLINKNNIESPQNNRIYNYYHSEKNKNILPKNTTKDGQYVFGAPLSKSIYNKHRDEIEVFENDKIKEKNSSKLMSSRRDFGDNYKYYERNEDKSIKRNEKVNHIRRSPVHVYGFQNYIMKDNKKIYLKTPPIKSKLIRIYRNNNNINCNLCYTNERKNLKIEPSSCVQGKTILLPRKFYKGGLKI